MRFNYVKKILKFKPHAILSTNSFSGGTFTFRLFWENPSCEVCKLQEMKKENKRAGHLILGPIKCKVECARSSSL